MAVLLGCDYLPQGVPGVGKEKVLQLVKEGVDLLELLQGEKTSEGVSGGGRKGKRRKRRGGGGK